MRHPAFLSASLPLGRLANAGPRLARATRGAEREVERLLAAI
jgi:hypothetical protein